MATTTSTTAPPRTLPAEVFAALTPSDYLNAVLSQNDSGSAKVQRANGRSPTQFRTPTFNTNSLVHCNGSAVVRAGGTSAVCGVRAELLHRKDIPIPPDIDLEREDIEAEGEEISGLNLLVPNIELSTGCDANNIPGNPPTQLAQALSHRLHTLLHLTHLVKASDLRITEARPDKRSLSADEIALDVDDDTDEPAVHAYWTLYIDIVFISLDGNPFDAAWLALLTALRSTRLPRAWYDRELETIICSPEVFESRILNLRGCPVASTFSVFEPAKLKGAKPDQHSRTWVLADPDAFEEGICSESVTVVVDRDQNERIRVRRIEKSGGSVVDASRLAECVESAGRRHMEYLMAVED